jgi:arylsulfatase A-like enzyme
VPAGKPNVVILLLDCLRADHVGVNGYHRDTTPSLDGLAAEGVNFSLAFAQAQWTRPSVPALLTGLYPSEHGVVSLQVGELRASAGALSPDVETLAESLKEHGYDTALIGEQAQLSRRFGLDQGFDLYNNRVRKAEKINRKFLGWASEREGRPFFAYLHYLDAHMPYCPPESTRGRFRTSGDGVPECLASRQMIEDVRYGRIELSADEITEMIAAYDEELAALDADLGDLFRKMKKKGLWDETLIVVTADHGEEFLEHGSIGHQKGLHDELIHVPLIIKQPASWDSPAGAVVDDVVELRDVSTTVLEALGVEPTAPRHSLLPWLVGRGDERDARRYVVSESSGSVSIRTPELKLVSEKESGVAELFDLIADPGETENLAGQRREELALLRGYLAEWQAGLTPYAAIDEEIDEETLEGLKTLGYLD